MCGAVFDLIGGEISRRENEDAIKDASREQSQSIDRALNLTRDIFDQQVELSAPFRQAGINQANFVGEITGFSPVGDAAPTANAMAAPQAPVNAGGPQNALSGLAAFSGQRSAPGESVMPYLDGSNPAPNRTLDAQPGPDGTFRATFARATPEAMTSPGTAAPTPAAPAGTNLVNGVDVAAQDRARQRWEGSLFNDALQGSLDRVATGVDANFAAMGNVYSGAHQAARADAAARHTLPYLNSYISAGLGQPSTAGAQMTSNALSQFGSSAGNLYLQQGQVGANSAFQNALNTNDFLQGIGNSFNSHAGQVMGFMG